MSVLKKYNAASGLWQAVGGMGLPQTPVSFSAHKNGTAQTVAAGGTMVKVTFPTVEWSTGSGYDATQSRFQPGIKGVYLVESDIRFASLNACTIVAQVQKNGAPVEQIVANTDAGYNSTKLSKLVYLNGSTDYVEIYAGHYADSSKDVMGGTDSTFFQACLIPDSYDSTKQIIDLTNATSDYLLGIGETAKITYTSATSVPLHIATQEGLYEFTISGNLSTTVANDNNISVLPNNTTYSAQFTEMGYKISSGNNSSIVLDANTNQFNTAWSNVVSANLSISTKTTAKTLQGTVLNKRVNGTTEHFTISSFWNNTSTAWTSLGTITFPFAQSGIIVIKRIA